MNKILVRAAEDFFKKLVENSLLIFFIGLNLKFGIISLFCNFVSSIFLELVKA